MSHCHPKCRCVAVLACTLAVAALAAAYLFGCPSSPLARHDFATRADIRSLREQGEGYVARLEMKLADDITAEVAASEKRSHGLREKLADRLRLELKAGDDEVRAEMAGLAERSANTFGDVGRDIGEIEAKLARIAAIEKKLAAVEKLWLDHRCPAAEPCKCSHTPPAAPPPPARVLPPGCPPNMYTIPYQRYYERPRP